jgi:Fe-S cluster biogenesis protein NfuA
VSRPDADARAVVAHFQRMVAADGSMVELAGLEGTRMRVRYAPGDCSDCVLAPEDLTGMMEEMLARRGSAITKVELA